MVCLQKIFEVVGAADQRGWETMAWRTLLILGWSVLVLALGPQASLAVTPYDDVMVRQAAKDIEQENYDEALAQLTEAWAKGAHTPEKAFMFGQVYRLSVMLNYAKAKEYLQEAVRLKPDFRPAQLMLADTLLAMDQPKEAKPILQSLLAAGYEPAQTAYLLGLTATKDGQYSQALDYFRQAENRAQAGPGGQIPGEPGPWPPSTGSRGPKDHGGEHCSQPQSQTTHLANRYLGIMSQRADELRPFRITVSTGFEYDSNVTLAPGGGPGDHGFREGQRRVFPIRLDGIHGLAHWSLQPFDPIRLFPEFSPTVQGYDVMSHLIGLTPTYAFKNGRFWLPINYTYMDLQSDKYYTGILVNPTYLHLFTEKIGLEVGARYNRQNYWTPVFLTQDDHTGNVWGGNVGMYYFFKQQKGFVQARLGYLYNNTYGNNWDSFSFNLLLSLLWPITEKLKYNMFLDLTQQPYGHTFYSGATVDNIQGAPLIPQPRRQDQILMFGMQFTYELFKGLEAGVHWYFIRDNSNINLYNYSRHIAGGQLAYRY